MLDAEPALEQQRHRRVPDPFVVVVGGDQRHGAVLAADPADDGGEDVGEFRADHQQPFGVGLGRGDLQQRDEFAGAGQPVLDEAVVGQLGEFLDADPGVAQDLDRGPGPERAVLFAGQVAALAGAGVLGPDPAGWASGFMAGRRSVCPAGGEQLRRARWPAAALQPPAAACGRRRPRRTGGQHRQPFAGPLVHPGLAVGASFLAGQVLGADRARRGPRSPPGRVLHRPLGDVEVEGAHRGQLVQARAGARVTSLISPPAGAAGVLIMTRCFQAAATSAGRCSESMPGWWSSRSRQNSPPSRRRDSAGWCGRRRAGVRAGRPPAGRGPAGRRCRTVDQLRRAELAAGAEQPASSTARFAEHAQRVQQLVEVRAGGLAVAQSASRGDLQQFQAVPDGDVGDRAALGRQDGRDPAQRQPRRRAVDAVAWHIAASSANPAGHGPGPSPRPGRRGGRGQQPVQARADHVGADQQHAAQARSSGTCSGSRGPRPAAASHQASRPRHGSPRRRRRWPATAAARCHRAGRQPVQQRIRPAAALLGPGSAGQGERRRQQPASTCSRRLVAGQVRRRAGREPGQQLRMGPGRPAAAAPL